MNSGKLLLLAVTSIGKVPPVMKDERTGETVIKGEDSDKLVTSAKYHVVELISIFAFCAGCVSMYMVSASLVDFMSVCVLVLAPIVAMQKHKLRILGDFRGQHNSLRTKIGTMRTEISRLHESINNLTVQTNRLSKVESDLKLIATKSGKSVDKLVQIVDENKQLQIEIRKNLNIEVIQQIMTAVLTTDTDRNFILSKNEVNILIMRLKQLPGIQFNEQSFRTFLNHNDELTLTEVCNITKNLYENTKSNTTTTIVQPTNNNNNNNGTTTKSRGLQQQQQSNNNNNKTRGIITTIDNQSQDATTEAVVVPPIVDYSPRDLIKKRGWLFLEF